MDALDEQKKEKLPFPDMSHAVLNESYPGAYQSLLQIIHTTGERINHTLIQRRGSDSK